MILGIYAIPNKFITFILRRLAYKLQATLKNFTNKH